jgi:hypothetical protein
MATYAYQWKRGGVNISGATSNSYLLVIADLGANITVTVTATNPAGSASATSAARGPVTVAAPANSVLPVITGSTVEGGVLTTTPGTWSGSPTYAYQWKRDVTNVGTNTNTYTSVTGDVGSTITVVVTATNAGGNASATSAAVGPITTSATAPANTVLPAISGTTSIGNVLTSTTGTWTGSPTITYAYQWTRAGSNIAGATASTYTLVTADVSTMIAVTVTATNGLGSVGATATAVGPISGAAALGAPTLDLAAASDSGSSSTDNITNDTTPEIIITFAVPLVAGDIVHVLDGGSEVNAHVVTALEAGSTTIALTGVSPLTNGSHSLTAHQERGGTAGTISSALVITVDTTGPVLSSPTGTQTGSSTATGTVSTDTGNGTLFWTADTSASPPSAAQIVAGQKASGAAADAFGSQAVSGTGVQSVPVTTLTGSTTYYLNYAHRDNVANVSSASQAAPLTTAAGGGGFSAEATQYFTRLPNDPGSSWKTVLAAFIDGLVTDGLWTGFDALQLYAHTTQANALIDLKGTVTPALTGAPTFTTKLGFSGFSASIYVGTGFTPSVNGVQFTTNNAHMSVYSQTAAASANVDVGTILAGTGACFMTLRNASNFLDVRFNNNAGTSIANTDGSGLLSTNRTTSTAGTCYRNGTSLGILGSNVTTAVPTAVLRVGFVNAAGSIRQFSLFSVGASRTAGQETNFNARVSTLMTAIGGL